jgi:hypothetical protein
MKTLTYLCHFKSEPIKPEGICTCHVQQWPTPPSNINGKEYKSNGIPGSFWVLKFINSAIVHRVPFKHLLEIQMMNYLLDLI